MEARDNNPKGISSGMEILDFLTDGFRDGTLSLIGSRPSGGKTSLALSLARNIAINNNIPAGYITTEISAYNIVSRIISMQSRIGIRWLRTGLLRPEDFSRLDQAASVISDKPLFITELTEPHADELCSEIRRMALNHDTKIIFIDSLIPYNWSNKASSLLKNLAGELRIPIAAAVNLEGTGVKRPPRIGDFEGYPRLAACADTIIFLHSRPAKKTEDRRRIYMPLIIQKARYGSTGTFHVCFMPECAEFRDLTTDEMLKDEKKKEK
jgi:replicative DNA helicase